MPARGPKRPLSRDRIVTVALEIMDEVVGGLADADLAGDLPFEDVVLEAVRLHRGVPLEHVRAAS